MVSRGFTEDFFFFLSIATVPREAILLLQNNANKLFKEQFCIH